MDILGPRICESHKMEANRMCTREKCFQNADILLCPECSSKHSTHQVQIIQVSLLNEKVHELMKKRMQFENSFEVSCQGLINELKKFKLFKQQLVTSLNIRQRILNDLCKKLKRNIPYEKDKQLFKHHFGYIYLTMKGINTNVEIYNKFRSQVTETISSCRKIVHKYELNCGHVEIPALRKKQHQISSILKKQQFPSQQVRFFRPQFEKFKKETIKFKNSADTLTKILRVSNSQFFVTHGDSFSWYSTPNFLFPKTFPIVKNKISNIALIDKNAFVTTEESYIYIYDVINEKLLKEYTSSNHRSATITDLLAVPNTTTVFNFITCPNQIVSLNFNESSGALKVQKGIETETKELQSKYMHDNFVAIFDNKIVDVFKTQTLEKERQFKFENLMKTADKITENSFVVGGESEVVSMVDLREKDLVMKLGVGEYCNNLAKIYPYCILVCCGKNLKIFDLRVQKEMFTTKSDENIKGVSVLNSENFVTCGSNLTLWSSM